MRPSAPSVTGSSRIPDAQDMAILKLFDSLGDWIGYFGSKPYSDRFNGHAYWNLAGYPGAIAGGQRTSILSIEYFRDGSGCKRRRPGHQQPGRRLVRRFGRPFLGDMA